MQINSRFDETRPLIFMHVPKCGGTSLDISLQNSLGFTTSKRFFGTVLHGADIGASYRSWHHNALSHAAIDDGLFVEESDYVVAHASFPELYRRHTNGQFITFLREPVCRLISLRTFVRSFSDETLSHFGTHGMAMLRARLSFKEYLSHPYFAASYDNVMTRMLLHGNALIPASDFIDPSNDEELIQKALEVLQGFAFVSAVDHPSVAEDISRYFGREIALEKENESFIVPAHLRCDLHSELVEGTMDLLENHSRLDLALWSYAMGFENCNAMSVLRNKLVDNCIKRHAKLLSD